MAYWLYITNLENWGITKNWNILGVSERYKNIISRINKDDRCLIYLKQGTEDSTIRSPKIVAEYQITSKSFLQRTVLFAAPPQQPNEIFSLRLRMTPITIFEPPVEFKPLINKLSFLKNKKNWGAHLIGRALISIEERDYKQILSGYK